MRALCRMRVERESSGWGGTNEREVDVVCRMGVEEDGGREEGEQREREAAGVYFFLLQAVWWFCVGH